MTVSVKLAFVVKEPSLTVRVMVAEPVWLGAGIIVTERLVPLPPSTMLEFGTRVKFAELAETVNVAAGVSTSPTVKGIAVVTVSSIVARLARVEIVGAVFAAVPAAGRRTKVLNSVGVWTFEKWVMVPVSGATWVRFSGTVIGAPVKVLLTTGVP